MSAQRNSTNGSRKRRKLSPLDDTQKETSNKQHMQIIESADVSIASTEELPSVKDLASSESSVRRAALKKIVKHIEARPCSSPISATECLQLWRGLFVSIYMHDSKNTLSVQNLLREIAAMFELFSAKDDECNEESRQSQDDSRGVSAGWLDNFHRSFWSTMVREWAGIDSHRMNKYLLLVRFVLKSLAKVCFQSAHSVTIRNEESNVRETKRQRKVKNPTKSDQSDEQPESKAQSAMEILADVGPLNSTDRKIPDGLRLHILDIFVDEVFAALNALNHSDEVDEKNNKQDTDKRTTDGVLRVLKCMEEPIVKMSQSDSGAQRHVRNKAKEEVARWSGLEKEYVSKQQHED